MNRGRAIFYCCSVLAAGVWSTVDFFLPSSLLQESMAGGPRYILHRKNEVGFASFRCDWTTKTNGNISLVSPSLSGEKISSLSLVSFHPPPLPHAAATTFPSLSAASSPPPPPPPPPPPLPPHPASTARPRTVDEEATTREAGKRSSRLKRLAVGWLRRLPWLWADRLEWRRAHGGAGGGMTGGKEEVGALGQGDFAGDGRASRPELD